MKICKKDFFDKEFHSFCQQEYDKGRHFLKTCGKPKDDLDKWFVQFHKDTVKIFSGFLFD